MSNLSPRMGLPFLLPSQAQKHVTHNEALQQLDALTQPAVLALAEVAPPASPEAGAMYGIGAGATGVWAGRDGALAYWDGTAWLFVSPQEGWRVWAQDVQELHVWRGGSWAPALQSTVQLGIGTTADATNRLSVASDASLFSHAGAGHQMKLNKASAGDTGSVLFQSDWVGHAEMGLAGDTAFSVKISADGASWDTVLRADPAAQEITFAPAGTARMVLSDTGLQLDAPVTGSAVQSAGSDGAAGKILMTGAQCLTNDSAAYSGLLPDAMGSWLVGFNDKADGPGALTGHGSDRYGMMVQVQRSSGRRHRIFQTLTGQMFHQTESAAGLQAPKRVYDTGNLLGTVSQAGGLPTGAMMEHGSNANGAYVRYADGTQICHKKLTLSGQDLNIAYGALFRSGSLLSGNTVFAAMFSEPPACTITAHVENLSTMTAVGGLGDVGNTPATVYAVAHTAVTGRVIHVNVMAIGRWY
ncbi:DUF2793 domain-containing protein [Pseudoprimorskyibacter insulae]|uniref:DUF2793 domain-containing protein n=1 Tax=Pseudoprimorskyibacter insulae TaxID=1695997 RepID=A0A2R8B0V9_9RHOB|nr:DUF2793 domain-containing protein [Pseudoprimorskyibacter insulae]SPF81794.1 hypothetical protein PRI8871_03619 [Pseudoprimorskyibacter insulae]